MLSRIKTFLSTIPFVGNVVRVKYNVRGPIKKVIDGYYIKVRYAVTGDLLSLVLTERDMKTAVDRYNTKVARDPAGASLPKTKGTVSVLKLEGTELIVACICAYSSGEITMLAMTKSQWSDCRTRFGDSPKGDGRVKFNLSVLQWIVLWLSGLFSKKG